MRMKIEMIATRGAPMGVPGSKGGFPKRIVSAKASAAEVKQAQRQARVENVEGNFFVDHTCIDCDTCRWMAPEVFAREGSMSAVTHQPETPEERRKTMQALLSCPTFSIHAKKTEKGEVNSVQSTFPIPVEGVEGVYHCGFHDASSFGSTSYLLVRSEGNILIDSPRFNPVLARKIEALGGIKWIFLTHKDDVGDHAKWAAKFEANRIIHKSEVNEIQGTVHCETQLEGSGPWFLEDGSKDVEFILVPGHSTGSICMFHSPTKALFSGDHMAHSIRYGDVALSLLTGYSWDVRKQIESTQKLLDYDFLHVLPGHGRRYHLKDASDRLECITKSMEVAKLRI